jgi:diguanylate cyclase (GGDEF)-like protein
MRRSDLFARLGGEEFALLLPGLDGDAAVTVAERIRCGQHEHARRDFGTLGSTVSIGLTCAPASEAGLSELLTIADHALYRAKATGGNAVVVGSPDDTEPIKPGAADRSPMPTAWPTGTRASR